MGEGPVTDTNKNGPASWRLQPPVDALTQGVVVSGFSKLPFGKALFLKFDWPPDAAGNATGRGSWLTTLQKIAPITDADGSDPRAAAIAFTWTGFAKLGLAPDALRSFSSPFQEGMYQEDRLRRLGDKIDNAWQATVIAGGPLWSGNCPVRVPIPSPPAGVDGPALPPERQVTTPLTVHALLLLYGTDVNLVGAWTEEVERALAPYGVNVVRRLSLDLQKDSNGIAREHFGFADGLSQPIPFEPGSVVLSNGPQLKKDEFHGVPLGEILIGHTNVHHENAPGPVVLDDDIGRSAGLTPDGAPVGYLNLGLNGSYMVVRELRQDVAAFWNSLDAAAAKLRANNTDTTTTAIWLAERIIGRNIDGHLLCPNGTLPPDEFGLPQNNFGYFENDEFGYGCAMGSHVRRANPRDGLAKDKGSRQTLLDAANNHRILRRGRKYGPLSKDPRGDDKQDRGLLFVCLNTDIARQFEFVQQTWILNKNLATLFDETDPLVGPKASFTIPRDPLRQIIDVETYIQSAGGEYFFLPSMPALDYLAKL